MPDLSDWTTNAVNLPEHADNAIHTDEGARAAGFPGALVAGVTVYAYMTHVPATAWGMAWLTSGGAEVRFRHPVMDRDIIDFAATDKARVHAKVAGELKAEATFSQVAETLPERDGEPLDPIEFVVDATWSDYGLRGGDDCPIYVRDSIAHPTSWPRIANQFCHDQLVNGSWIHVRSTVQHLGVAPVGSTIRATANVFERFDSRAGERATLDVRISANGRPVAAIEHEAIIRLTS
jgi:acyl dehydratase